jgi:hypothetical protein
MLTFADALKDRSEISPLNHEMRFDLPRFDVYHQRGEFNEAFE